MSGSTGRTCKAIFFQTRSGYLYSLHDRYVDLRVLVKMGKNAHACGLVDGGSGCTYVLVDGNTTHFGSDKNTRTAIYFLSLVLVKIFHDPATRTHQWSFINARNVPYT